MAVDVVSLHVPAAQLELKSAGACGPVTTAVIVLRRSLFSTLLLQVRQSAGLLLKNNLKQQYAGLTEDFRNYIKVCVLVCLGGGRHVCRQRGDV